MTKPKLTEWIRCVDQQPTIPGWYDIKYNGWKETSHRLWFDGERWKNNIVTVAKVYGYLLPDYPGDSWRGLAEDPNKCK